MKISNETSVVSNDSKTIAKSQRFQSYKSSVSVEITINMF